ncbi:hypothetical protein SORBI_3006G252400 [Sorghum bicolor]|uniref:U3 small nucleolar ribonucleoprotein protein IMP3 n=1 Tax=Sorghum bicolor TaxID=4558 RepID=A0A1Z5RFG5_SORBI|nr:hypothetical protein SORBI_3006G252400 [Sorghum bicolor]
MRKLAFHERKRLKRVNLLDYDKGKGRREGRVTQRYHIVERDDYTKYNMGVISIKESLVKCEKLSASSFCRRRLATVMTRIKMAEHLKEAVTYIEQGHVRVGPEVVTDPAFLVTRNMEDFITWVDSSKIKKKVMEYNDALDDYDAMG